MEYRNVQGYGKTATNVNDAIPGGSTSYTSSLTFTNTAGNGGAIVETDQNFGCGTGCTIAYNNGQTQRQGNLAFAGVADDYGVAAATFTISNTWTWASPACGAPPACFDSHSGLELLGSTIQPVTTITQCYGNCGSPAITLANTNSTHTLNWNQSITMFYIFQPTISGFLNNVTTSLPKTYPSSFYAPFLAFYQSNCPINQTPFSQQCPGLQLVGGQTASFSKGKTSILGGINNIVTSSATIWYAVSLSFQLAPEDVNDTNTQVAIHVTTGTSPSTITQDGVFNPNSKIGIWAWITGNIISSLPPPTPNPAGCVGLLDCLLPQWAQSLCSNPTAACVNGAGLVEVVLLTVISVFFIVKSAGEVGNIKLPIGEFVLFFAVIWIFVLSGAGIFFIWVPVLIFFIVSLLMSKNLARYL